MKVAIEMFVSLFILALVMSICVGLISLDLSVMEARDNYYSYVNELQESNFADSVIDACIKDAKDDGYTLEIEIMEDDNGNRSANIQLDFVCKLAPIKISQKKTIKGYIS